MPTFLFKTEPTDFSFQDLVRERAATWDGVTNNGALLALRGIRKGDEILVYHTGEERAIVGLAKALGSPYEDPAQPGRTPKGEPKFAVLDVAPIRAARQPATLDAIKADPRFASFSLVRNSRLSVMIVPAEMDKPLRKLAGLDR